MLEVLPIQEKSQHELLFKLCGIPFRVDSLAYQALVDGELRGICQFTMDGNGGRIQDPLSAANRNTQWSFSNPPQAE